MRKVISVLVLVVMVVALATTIVNATTSSSLVNDLYALTSKYGITAADKVKAERFLAENTITDAQAQQIYAKIQEAVKVLENAGITDAKQIEEKLTEAQKQQIESICQEAAGIIGVTLTYKNGAVEVYKDGKMIEVFSFTNGKLAYTGNNVNVVLVVSSVAVIALAVVFVVRKKFANA